MKVIIYKILKQTSGKLHSWCLSNVGIIRKENKNIKLSVEETKVSIEEKKLKWLERLFNWLKKLIHLTRNLFGCKMDNIVII